LGTGLTAISVAKVLDEVGIKFSVIDAGINHNQLLESKELKEFTKKFSSPKLSSIDDSFAFKEFSKHINIKENNFASIGSLASGGLSNIWGAGISKYSKSELARACSFNKPEYVETSYLKINELLQENKELGFRSVSNFRKIYPEILINSACQGLYENQFINNQKLIFNLPTNAIKRTSKINDASKHQNAWMGEFKNLEIFNSKFIFEQIFHKNKNSLISNTLIRSISKKDNIFIIDCINKITNEEVQIKAKEIFCCLGVLTTTKIVLEMEKSFNTKLPILNTPAASFISFCFQKNYYAGNLSLNNLNFELNLNNETISGGVFPMTPSLFNKISQKWILPEGVKKLLYRLFFSRILISNIFFPSTYSQNTISLSEKNILSIEGKNKRKKVMNGFKYIIRLLKAEFKKERILILPLTKKILKPGEDIHYGGTIQSNRKNSISTNNKGQLCNNQNFYICDSSSMNYLGGKPHSFNAMVNARVIAMTYASKKEKKF